MLTLESRKLDLSSENPEGDFGVDGFESWNNRGLLFVFGVEDMLHWSFGLLGTDEGGLAEQVVRHRRLGLETG